MPDRDIAPVSIVGTGGQILIVHPSVPVRSVTEFVAFAKSAAAKKEPIAYASAGNGTASHLAMEYFRLHAGFEAIHVPYRSVAPLVVDLLAGQVKVAFVGTSVIVDHVRAGRLSGLGVSHDQPRAARSRCADDRRVRAMSGSKSKPFLYCSRQRDFPGRLQEFWSAKCRPRSSSPIWPSVFA